MNLCWVKFIALFLEVLLVSSCSKRDRAPPETSVPVSPIDPVVSEITKTSLTLKWTSPAESIEGFIVRYKEESDDALWREASFISTSEYQINQLIPDTIYSIDLISVHGGMLSPPITIRIKTTQKEYEGRIANVSPVDPPDDGSGYNWMGLGFVAVETKGEIAIWGGFLGSYTLPKDKIHVYNPISKSWRSVKVEGEIPRHSDRCAFVALDNIVYIFGGTTGTGTTATDDIFSLEIESTTGVFKRLNVKGTKPTPRYSLEGWSHQGKLYFWGGRDPSGMAEADNLWSFDPSSETWTTADTSGDDAPGQLADYAVAKIEDDVFVYGGEDRSDVLSRFMYVLSMTTLSWRKVSDVAAPATFANSLTPISTNRLMATGGYDDDNESGPLDPIWIFDVSSESWKETSVTVPNGMENKLKTAGSAVAVKTKTHFSVFCAGEEMVIFDIE